MLVKIEARILIFPGTGFHFPSASVPPGTFLGSALASYSSRDPHAYTGMSKNARVPRRQITRVPCTR